MVEVRRCSAGGGRQHYSEVRLSVVALYLRGSLILQMAIYFKSQDEPVVLT
jgi:hypothetical protein